MDWNCNWTAVCRQCLYDVAFGMCLYWLRVFLYASTIHLFVSFIYLFWLLLSFISESVIHSACTLYVMHDTLCAVCVYVLAKRKSLPRQIISSQTFMANIKRKFILHTLITSKSLVSYAYVKYFNDISLYVPLPLFFFCLFVPPCFHFGAIKVCV